MDRTPRSISDYDAVIDPIRAARQAKSGKQPGDPAKAAQALLALVESPRPPVRLFLGDDALQLVEQKLAAIVKKSPPGKRCRARPASLSKAQ